MASSDDPWDWDVDRVVREFCTSNRSWIPTERLYLLPDPKKFADKLSDNEVDGTTLLLAVNEQFMREELGLENYQLKLSYKARWTMTDAISQLRTRSAKYKEYVRTRNMNSLRASAEDEQADQAGGKQTDTAIPHGNTTNGVGGEVHTHVAAGEIFSLPVLVGVESTYAVEQADEHTDSAHSAESIEQSKMRTNGRNDETGSLMGADEFSALLGADTVPSESLMEVDTPAVASEALQSHTVLPLAAADTTITINLLPQDSAPIPGVETKRKPQRMAPTLITTKLDLTRDRELRTEADNVILNRPDRFVPHAVTVREDGKKRLAPNLISAKTSGEIIAGGLANLEAAQELAKVAQVKQARTRVDLSKGYLGAVEMPVDDIFFSNAQLGSSCEQPDTDDNFVELERDISTGRRLYVAKRMRHFLMSQPKLVKKGGKSYIARQPYPEYLVSASKPTSFMLAQTTDAGDVVVTRENTAQWPELESDNFKPIANDDEHLAMSNMPGGEFPLSGPSSYDTWDPEERLRKYQHLPEDEILPVYGESDEENEFDLETWREMESENGEMEQHYFESKRKRLTTEEINEAMDDGMGSLHSKWHEIHFPKLRRKAYYIWMKHRGHKREQIASLEKKLNALVNERIPKMREEILKQVWTTQKQVRRQCQIMERTIFDREEINWEITLLKDKERPSKPPPLPKKEKQAAIGTTKKEVHGDSESIGSTSDEDEEEDELDDFIIDDDFDAAEYRAMIDQSVSQSEDDSNASSVGAVPAHDVMDADIEMANAQMPDAEDAEEVEDDEDLKVRTPSRRRPKVPASAQQNTEPIDLTGDTPPLSHDASRRGSESAHRQRQPVLRPDAQPSASDTILVSSDDEMPDVSEEEEPLPTLDEVGRIVEHGMEYWQKRGDRDRMLATKLAKVRTGARDNISKYFEGLNDLGDDEIWDDMKAVMAASRDKTDNVRGIDNNQYKTITGVVRLFMLYTYGQDLPKRDRFSGQACNMLFSRKDDVGPFLQVCRTVLNGLQPVAPPEASDHEELPTPVRQRTRIRIRPVYQDTKALKMRTLNQDKVAEQQKRREELRQKLAAAPLSGVNTDLIINVSKGEDEGFIFVPLEIGLYIKPHQMEGIRFMWNQIVAKVEDEELQGCLLAHTMGLGKTMQAITLLVAIAEAAHSDDPSISSQIPEALRESRTLILAPAGLLDNWMDELNRWVPDDALPKLGRTRGEEFRKIGASSPLSARLREINAWHEEGGVLIMGFNGFRDIISKADGGQGESDSKPAGETYNYVKAKLQLLKGPNIVIADEAHNLKNANSKIHITATQFRTNSRIALTGSPLSNNVVEYHSMINWVAPNYLGPIVEFRAKYVEPIQAGLYVNSTRTERRRSIKMLEVLKQNIQPKVHRCGVEVLLGDLPPKTEFIIMLPLTDLQTELYKLYVQANDSASLSEDQITQKGTIRQTTLWTWMNMLQLLCNHPACYINRLETPDKLVKTAENAEVGVQEVQKLTNKHHELASSVREVIGDYDEMAKAIEDSHKIQVICKILDVARKEKDKVLVFSQSIPTINFLKRLFTRQGRKLAILTGDTAIKGRQGAVKDFNSSDREVFLISTTAGGTGLNLPGANRVIIVDSKWSPANEDQAVGRAYRLGQTKHVFVYRLIVAGTFEEKLHNQTIFKTQLAAQVVDKKNIRANALKEKTNYLFEPKEVSQKDLSEFKGKDKVLDKLLRHAEDFKISEILMSEAFNRIDDEALTVEERREVEGTLAEERLRREDPKAWQAKKDAREADVQRRAQIEFDLHRANYNAANAISGGASHHFRPPPPPSSSPPSLKAAQQRLPIMMNSSIRPSSQTPGAKEPIMGSGTRMAPADDLTSQEGITGPTAKSMGQPRPRVSLALSDRLTAALGLKASDKYRQDIPRRAREFVAYIAEQRPNELYLLETRIDLACGAFSKYATTTNDFISGSRSVASIVNEVLDGQLGVPPSAAVTSYSPGIETQKGDTCGDTKRLERQGSRKQDITIRETGAPKVSSSVRLMKEIEKRFALILNDSIAQSMRDQPTLTPPAHDPKKLAELFSTEISNAVIRELQKQGGKDLDETNKDVVFARASDWFMRKMKDLAVCTRWMEAKENIQTFVKREMRKYLATQNALAPALPPDPANRPSQNKKKAAPIIISTPTPEPKETAQNSSKQSRPAQVDGANSATGTDPLAPHRRESRIQPRTSLSSSKTNQSMPLSAQSLFENLSGKKKPMPWDNKRRRSGLWTETTVPAPPRWSRPRNNSPNLNGFETSEPASPSPFRPSTPQPAQPQPSPSSTKSLPSRPLAKESNLKDASHSQASATASGRKFNWARDESLEEGGSTVSGTPTSTTSSRYRASSQSQPGELQPKRQKIEKRKSILPSWAKREVASSQITPTRRRGGSVASNMSGRSGRSTPGPRAQP